MRFVLGTVQFGMDYGIQGGKRPSEERVDEILTYALEHDIHYFDSASAYGDAEKVIGHYVKRHGHESKQMRVISKLASSAWKDVPKKMWADKVLECAKESIKMLGVRQLEAYLFHDASYIYDENAVKALVKAVEEGVTEKIGVSIYSPEEAMEALEYDEVKVIQIPYNVFDQRLDQCGFFKEAKQKAFKCMQEVHFCRGLL